MRKDLSLPCKYVNGECREDCNVAKLVGNSFFGKNIYNGGTDVQVYWSEESKTITVLLNKDSKDKSDTCSFSIVSSGPEAKDMICYASEAVTNEKLLPFVK